MCIHARESEKERERERARQGEGEEKRGESKLHIVDTGIHRITYTNHIGRYLLPYYVGHVHSWAMHLR